ncbi:ATPase [Gaoshiqia sp. Z1-71]|uniref:ATPase n=1 Tax=Gaoshiqia hydrogeniformans TaxID=3290090 RepID=UPI003BF82582
MKRLIADSGSTKADWRLIGHTNEVSSFQTRGMNPFFRTSDDIFQELQEKIFPETGGDVDEIFFYGAGVVDQEKGNVLKEAFTRLFPRARVETHSDVLGASRALFGREAGIACILGTGSNACFYDGIHITKKVPPLGFILGDECSGAALGKKLLGDYFKQVMPPAIRLLFEQEFSPVQTDVLNRVYRTERPNKYLAGFAPFLSAQLHEPYCLNMVEESFREFFERNVLRLPEITGYPIGFAGSVAYHFRDIIISQTEAYGFSHPIILKEPIAGLTAYHKSQH